MLSSFPTVDHHICVNNNNIIIYLIANGLSPGGSGYTACT